MLIVKFNFLFYVNCRFTELDGNKFVISLFIPRCLLFELPPKLSLFGFNSPYSSSNLLLLNVLSNKVGILFDLKLFSTSKVVIQLSNDNRELVVCVFIFDRVCCLEKKGCSRVSRDFCNVINLRLVSIRVGVNCKLAKLVSLLAFCSLSDC
jgi:hypothetical protein